MLGWVEVIIINLITIAAGTLSIVYFYFVAVQDVHGDNWKSYVKYIPVALALGAGLAVNNSKAVLEAVFGKQSEFRRTPKFALKSRKENWRSRSYVSSKEVTAILELALGLFFLLQTFYALYKGYIGWLPFLLLLQFGFIYVSLFSIIHSSRRA